MDPLSITAATVGLLGATVKVSTILTAFIRRVRNAPKVAHNILQEVSDMCACLAQIQAFLTGTKIGSRSGTALLMVDQIVTVLTSSVMTFSELEEVLHLLI